MPQSLPSQPGKFGGATPKPTASQPLKKEQFAFDRYRDGLSQSQLITEFSKLPSNYIGRSYSQADKQKVAQELIKETGGSYITKPGLRQLRSKLGKGLLYGPAEQRAENKRRLEMIQKIFGNQ